MSDYRSGNICFPKPQKFDINEWLETRKSEKIVSSSQPDSKSTFARANSVKSKKEKLSAPDSSFAYHLSKQKLRKTKEVNKSSEKMKSILLSREELAKRRRDLAQHVGKHKQKNMITTSNQQRKTKNVEKLDYDHEKKVIFNGITKMLERLAKLDSSASWIETMHEKIEETVNDSILNISTKVNENNDESDKTSPDSNNNLLQKEINQGVHFKAESHDNEYDHNTSTAEYKTNPLIETQEEKGQITTRKDLRIHTKHHRAAQRLAQRSKVAYYIANRGILKQKHDNNTTTRTTNGNTKSTQINIIKKRIGGDVTTKSKTKNKSFVRKIKKKKKLKHQNIKPINPLAHDNGSSTTRIPNDTMEDVKAVLTRGKKTKSRIRRTLNKRVIAGNSTVKSKSKSKSKTTTKNSTTRLKNRQQHKSVMRLSSSTTASSRGKCIQNDKISIHHSNNVNLLIPPLSSLYNEAIRTRKTKVWKQERANDNKNNSNLEDVAPESISKDVFRSKNISRKSPVTRSTRISLRRKNMKFNTSKEMENREEDTLLNDENFLQSMLKTTDLLDNNSNDNNNNNISDIPPLPLPLPSPFNNDNNNNNSNNNNDKNVDNKGDNGPFSTSNSHSSVTVTHAPTNMCPVCVEPLEVHTHEAFTKCSDELQESNSNYLANIRNGATNARTSGRVQPSELSVKPRRSKVATGNMREVRHHNSQQNISEFKETFVSENSLSAFETDEFDESSLLEECPQCFKSLDLHSEKEIDSCIAKQEMFEKYQLDQ